MASQPPFFKQWTDESNRQKTVLVIEHQPTIAELLVFSLNLAEYGCSIIDAMDMTSPAWIENSINTLPDGIILDADIRTAEFKNSLDLVHAFCMHWKNAVMPAPMPPLILLTTQAIFSTELQREGYTVVMKPFKPYALLGLVKTAIERKREGGAVKVEIVASAFI